MDNLDRLAERGKQDRLAEQEDRASRTEFTLSELEDNYDELFSRVEHGEMLTIIYENGLNVLMVPHLCQTGYTRRSGSN